MENRGGPRAPFNVMNGNDDKGAPKPSKNPFFDESDAPPPARVRPRRAKPPPGIITAGGVDMARAHASDIRVRSAPAPGRPVDEPKVVVAVDVDERKVPTRRKIFEGRDAADERAAMLPEGAAAARPAAVEPAPKPKPKPSATTTTPTGRAPAAKDLPAAAPAAAEPDQALPAWMRVAFVLVLALLAFGLTRRARAFLFPEPEPLTTAGITVAPPPVTMEPPAKPAPIEPAEPVKAAPTNVPAARTVAIKAPPAPPTPAKPAFTPPFQLPGEKK